MSSDGRRRRNLESNKYMVGDPGMENPARDAYRKMRLSEAYATIRGIVQQHTQSGGNTNHARNPEI